MKTICLQEKSYVHFLIRQVGTGGNGGYFFRNLLQLISSYKAATKSGYREEVLYDVLIADGDIVVEKEFEKPTFLRRRCF